jgi:hypothetical protein
MFTKLAGFRPFESWRAASGLPSAMHSNDNLPGFRRPAGQRRSPKSALACHWYPIGDEGRLECRWQAEANDGAPMDDLDQHRVIGRTFDLSSVRLRGSALAAQTAG